MKKIKLLIVDDSVVVRKIISREIAKFPEIEIVGTAPDPYVARDLIVERDPDVLSLDIEMPRMDGITFLEKLARYHPMPVVIFSSLTPVNSETALRALELGAVEVMQKPWLNDSFTLQEMMILLADKIKAAAAVKYRFKKGVPLIKKPGAPSEIKAMIKTTDKVIAIGASTGGVEAIRSILPRLPGDFPGVVVVQHMPQMFTASFAKDLNRLCQMEVREARDGDTIHPGLALIAPGNQHLLVRRSGAQYLTSLNQGPLVCRQRPSVEVFFGSISKFVGANAIGVMLSGMGNDGASAMTKMRDAGAYNIAQDEGSCVVFGMPKEAIAHGAVHKVLPLDKIADELVALCSV
jgi:two-component system chemotaxis response regulator CheB